MPDWRACARPNTRSMGIRYIVVKTTFSVWRRVCAPLLQSTISRFPSWSFITAMQLSGGAIIGRAVPSWMAGGAVTEDGRAASGPSCLCQCGVVDRRRGLRGALWLCHPYPPPAGWCDAIRRVELMDFQNCDSGLHIASARRSGIQPSARTPKMNAPEAHTRCQYSRRHQGIQSNSIRGSRMARSGHTTSTTARTIGAIRNGIIAL